MGMTGSTLRMDLWLFYARLYKSRSKATEACKMGRIVRNGIPANAADSVSVGDTIKIRSKGVYRQFRVVEIPPKNLSKVEAKRVYDDETPQEIIDRLELQRMEAAIRRQTKGKSGARPTKKERRIIDKSRGR